MTRLGADPFAGLAPSPATLERLRQNGVAIVAAEEIEFDAFRAAIAGLRT